MTFRQLSLAVSLDSQATFDTFYRGEGSSREQAVSLLSSQDEPYIFLAGTRGSGLSHLLQATCQRGGIYLPLQDVLDYAPELICEGLEQVSLLCLDNLQAVADRAEWQQALFHLFNRCRDNGTRLVIAAHAVPDQLGVQLPDLLSRLKSGITLQLPDYSDEELLSLLQFRATCCGLELGDEVARFLIHRLPRNTSALMASLQQLDRASLEEQRRLTLPFVKSVLRL